MTKQKKAKLVSKHKLVFISHHGVDSWVAKQIEVQVKKLGADVFLDRTQNLIGEEFEEKIMAALGKSDELLVLLTPWALNRPYVWTEVGFALGKKIPIVGVLYGVQPGDPAIPEYMRRRIMIDVNELDKYFDQLRVRIKPKKRRSKI